MMRRIFQDHHGLIIVVTAVVVYAVIMYTIFYGLAYS